MPELRTIQPPKDLPRSLNERAQAGMLPPAAGVIHDLGNLIQIATSAVNIVSRNPATQIPDLEPALSGARSSLERAGALVRQGIAIMSERSAAATLVDMSACLKAVVSLLQVAWDPRIELTIRAHPDLPVLRCDPLGLQSAVLNLLFNARDAMPGGGTIAVNAEPAWLESGPGVELRITDTGIGMTADTVRRALDPFFTTKSDGLGGVGLPMVQRFVHELGGRMSIESEYGVGTTVALHLPAFAASISASTDAAPRYHPMTRTQE